MELPGSLLPYNLSHAGGKRPWLGGPWSLWFEEKMILLVAYNDMYIYYRGNCVLKIVGNTSVL